MSAAPMSDAMARKVKELAELRDTMLEEIELARAELALRERRLNDAELELAATRQRLADSERDNTRLQRELGELIDRVFEQDDLLNEDDAIHELRREVDQLRRDNAELHARVAAASAARPTDSARIEAATDALVEELARAVSERDEARNEAKTLEDQVQRGWAEMDAVAKELDEVREDLLAFKDLKREHAALLRQRDELQAAIEEQRVRMRDLGGRDAHEREMTIARELIASLEAQCQRTESRLAGYKTELVELRAHNAELRKLLSAFGRRVAAPAGIRSRRRSD